MTPDRENVGLLTKTKHKNLDCRFLLSQIRKIFKKYEDMEDGLVSLGIVDGVLVMDLLRSSYHRTNRVGITYPKEKPSKLQIAETANLLNFTFKQLLENRQEKTK